MSIWTDLTGIPFCVEFVDAGGIKTRALIAGEGEAVVMLHGTSGHLEAFARNFVPLVEAGYNCHAIDALGHGYTDKPDTPYEVYKYAKHVLDYLDAKNIEKAHFLGESLGGWTSAWIAINNPERVASLQLIAAGGTKANPEVMERLKTSTKRAVETDDKDLTRQRLHLLMHNPAKDVSEELVDIRHEIYHREDFVRNIDNLLTLQNMDVRQRNMLKPEDLQQIKAPTLVVWGNQNPFGGVAEATAMNENIANSDLIIYNECGHWPQHEHAESYNPTCIDFLKKNAAA